MFSPMKWFAECWDDGDEQHVITGPFMNYTEAKHGSAQLKFDNVDLFWK